MKKMKKLSIRSDESIAYTLLPRTGEEIWERIQAYKKLEPKLFANKHGFDWNEAFTLCYNDKEYPIQFNFCTDPFCAWYGLPQKKFKGKAHRYKRSGKPDVEPVIICNQNPVKGSEKPITPKTSALLSNFAISEEISRLANVNHIVEKRPDYNFHKDGCPNYKSTPFNAPDDFKKRGTSNTNSQRWQCKSCNKLTNTLPPIRKCFNYHQKRNDILVQLSKLMMSRMPVKRICEHLEIGSSTYYSKMKLLYQRCLEFLEEHETKAFATKQFKDMYLDTDIMVYFLNNVRQKGKSGKWFEEKSREEELETHIVATGEILSRYVLRADVAFTWNTVMEELFATTFGLKEDHIYPYQRANGHLRKYQFYPQPPTPYDTQTRKEYEEELEKIETRAQYIEGFHVNSTYTALAQYWLIKQMINTEYWWLNSDDDNSLKTAILRVFADEISEQKAHYFISCIDDRKSRRKAYEEYKMHAKGLAEWGTHKGLKIDSVENLAKKYLEIFLEAQPLYEYVEKDGVKYPILSNVIEHPLPSIDEGSRDIRCLTDLSGYSRKEQAEIISQINSRVLKSFFGQARRRISVLERPFVTARGNKKSYIYANCNPEYAQYAITILRTLHNFCRPWKSYEKVNVNGRTKKVVADRLTPAQRLGITDRVFDIRDIIYFK